MNLKDRLDILKVAGSIDDETYEKVISVIEKVLTNWEIELTEENGAMLITHLATALTRIKKGDSVNPLDESILSELKEYEKYSLAEEIYEDVILDENLVISENEKQYIMMHLCSLLQNIN